MVRLRDELIQSQETGDDIDAVQIADTVCDQVLGVHSGYIKGLGSGPKPVRSTSSDATSSSRVSNAALREKLQSTEESLASTREELADTRARLTNNEDELASMRSRQAMIESILDRLAPGALQSLLQESSSAPPPPPPRS